MEIRTGQFGVFENELFNLIKKEDLLCRLVIRTAQITDKQKSMGFKEYANSTYTLDINCSALDSAFSVITYCNYSGFKFQATDLLSNGKIRFGIPQKPKCILRIMHIMDMTHT